MKRVFFTTTDTINNGQITSNCGVIATHIVAKTGVPVDYSDDSRWLTEAYQGRLDCLYNAALDELSYRAHQLGANCVVGLKVEINKLPGKDMPLFVYSAVGTAAVVKFGQDEANSSSKKTVSGKRLMVELEKRNLLKVMAGGAMPVGESWDFIVDNPDNDYVEHLTRLYFKSTDKDYPSMYKSFISLVDREPLVDAVYKCIKDMEVDLRLAYDLIYDYQLFDAKSIISLLESGKLHAAIDFLDAEQPSYSESDLLDMKQLLSILDSLLDSGMAESGLDENEQRAIVRFKTRIEVLSELLATA